MQKYIKIDSDPEFIRDTESGAIINTNDSYYKQILAQRSNSKKTAEVCEKMNSLESELSEIKMMLQQILNGRRDG